MDDTLLSAAEVRAIIGCGRSTLEKWLAEGKFMHAVVKHQRQHPRHHVIDQHPRQRVIRSPVHVMAFAVVINAPDDQPAIHSCDLMNCSRVNERR